MKTYTLKIQTIKKETEDTYTFCFKQPGLKKIQYLAGQYLTLIVNVNNRKYRRPYSFSSAPGLDSTLDITVKRVLHGVVSNHLIDTLKVGDLLEVLEPLGQFVFVDAKINQDIFLWGAGSGITPLMSILKVALNNGVNRVFLNYCNRNRSDTIFFSQLLKYREDYPERFHLSLYCTQENSSHTIHSRITEKYISEILDNCSSPSTSLHYICGPEGLKTAIKFVLSKKGVNNDNIFFEEFEHFINEEELNDIETKSVVIELNGKPNLIEVVRGKSILEAALDFGLELSYSCQTGTCKLCRAMLVQGQVKHLDHLETEEIRFANENLLCCSYPLSDDVHFKIN